MTRWLIACAALLAVALSVAALTVALTRPGPAAPTSVCVGSPYANCGHGSPYATGSSYAGR